MNTERGYMLYKLNKRLPSLLKQQNIELISPEFGPEQLNELYPLIVGSCDVSD